MGMANTYYHTVVASLMFPLRRNERVPEILDLEKEEFKKILNRDIKLGRIYASIAYQDSTTNEQVFIVDGREYDSCYYITANNYDTLVKFLKTYGFSARVMEIELGQEIECTQ